MALVGSFAFSKATGIKILNSAAIALIIAAHITQWTLGSFEHQCIQVQQEQKLRVQSLGSMGHL